MKIIEIRKTQYGEVAYVYDEINGRVLKLLVEDMTGYGEEEERPIVKPRRRIRPVDMPTYDGGILEEEDLPPLEEKPLAKPRVAPKNIIPPHLRGVFIPNDQPGAAVERREVGA